MRKYCDIWVYELIRLENFTKNKLTGVIGDQSGVREYEKIENKSLDKWKKTLKNRTRIRIAKDIISKIDPNSLKIQGYEYSQLIAQLNSFNYDKTPDPIELIAWKRSQLIQKYKLNLLFGKNTSKQIRNKLFS